MADRKIPHEFSFEALPEDEGPEGHFATGDKDQDEEICEEIRLRLAGGDLAAWFTAKVTCFGPEGFEGVAYLGACNYESFEDFEKSDYYASMCDEAYMDMVSNIRAMVKQGNEAKDLLAEYGEIE